MDDRDYDFLNLVYCRQCSIRFRHPNYAFLASKDLIESFQKPFVIVRSNVYFAPALFANINHRNRLCSEYSPSSLFHTLFSKLLTLSAELQAELDEAAAPFQGKDAIGIQIRLKDRVGFPPNRVGSFFNCATALLSKYNNSIVFIASDSEGLKMQAQLAFGDRLYRTTQKPRQFSAAGIKAAVIDLMLLSKCKELLLTPFSTFGSVAAGIGDVVPHFVTREEGFCVKDLRSEPKFHYWHALSSYSIPQLGSSDMVNQDDSFM
jgi:hypothetical protein